MADLTRRDLIRRGAVAGGIIWAVPVVATFDQSAFAAAGSPNCVTPAPQCSPGSVKIGTKTTIFHVCAAFTVAQAECICCCNGDSNACGKCPQYQSTTGNGQAKLAAACKAGKPTTWTCMDGLTCTPTSCQGVIGSCP